MSDIMSAERIKSIRARYGLSQRSFAKLLGIGEASMVRYENGVEPSKANANLLRAAEDPKFMQGCIERDGGSIPQAQRARVEECVYTYMRIDADELDGIEKEEPMDEMSRIYHYTLQQEVLNEQAANIVCDIIRYMAENDITTNDTDHPLVLLSNNLFKIKQLIICEASRDDAMLEQIRGYLKYTEEWVGEFLSMQEAA